MTTKKTTKKTTKHPGGRPSKYKDEYVEQARKLCMLGATDKDMANFFGTSEQTLNSWKEKHPEFLESLRLSKAEHDNKHVVRSLLERATGYSHPDTHISNFQGEITVTPITKHYPPDPTSMIFWLKNRQSQDWKDKHEIGTDPDAPIEVHINFPKES